MTPRSPIASEPSFDEAFSPTEALEAPPASDTAIRGFLRGSSLLLVGRFASVLLNFAVQVLIVRYLAKSDYGAFAYALGVVSMTTSLSLLGTGKSIPRLVAIYHERKDYSRAFGLITMAVTVAWGIGALLLLLLHSFKVVAGERLGIEPLSMSVLLILITLAPVDAFDHLLQQMSAIFAGPRTIFFRRQIFGPAFKLATVVAVMYFSSGVHMLAYGYLLGSLIGVGMYVATLFRTWRAQGVLNDVRMKRMRFPVRELVDFSLPLLSAEITIILRASAAVMLLQYFCTAADVADYRAVLPVAGLNMLVFEAFGFLFVPVASRMFARKDTAGISDLYWQTSLWIAVLTFPILAATCAFSGRLTVWLFGADYAGATMLLSVLACGYYFNAATGFNAASLRVHGKLRTIVIVNVVAGVACVAMSAVLIRAYGSLGAAISTTATLVLHNVLNHVGLWANNTRIRLFAGEFLRSYGVIAGAVAVLVVAEWLAEPPVVVGLVAIAGFWLLLLRMTRQMLDVQGRFPELLRVPFMRQLFT